MKRKILQVILGFLSKKIIKKYKPKIIAITGSAGKTTTKDAIAFFLEKHFFIRKSIGNLNTEFGLPLVFIGVAEGGGNSFSKWASIISKGFSLLFKKVKYPEIIIAEMGADKPGDIRYLTKIAKPDIGIITWIGDIPVHIEAYQSVEDIAEEKSQIIRRLSKKNISILNFDDEQIREIREESKTINYYFGFNEGADILLSSLKNETIQKNGILKPHGISFEINYQGKNYKIHLPHCLGKSFAYAVGAAFAVAVAMKADLSNFADTFLEFRPEKGRMNMINGIDGTFIIDDSYNSSPAALKLALETFKDLSFPRKIAVLGDMKELGKYSKTAHSKIGEKLLFCDVLITFGNQAKVIAESAEEEGMKNQNIYHFNNINSVVEKMKELSRPGDLILIKGSRSMEMDKIIEELVID